MLSRKDRSSHEIHQNYRTHPGRIRGQDWVNHHATLFSRERQHDVLVTVDNVKLKLLRTTLQYLSIPFTLLHIGSDATACSSKSTHMVSGGCGNGSPTMSLGRQVSRPCHIKASYGINSEMFTRSPDQALRGLS